VWRFVAKAKAFGIRAIGRWYLERKSKRQDHLARTFATIPDEVSLYLNSKPLIHENQGLFCFKRFLFELKNESDALMKGA
jgi:hypothetical protein